MDEMYTVPLLVRPEALTTSDRLRPQDCREYRKMIICVPVVDNARFRAADFEIKLSSQLQAIATSDSLALKQPKHPHSPHVVTKSLFHNFESILILI